MFSTIQYVVDSTNRRLVLESDAAVVDTAITTGDIADIPVESIETPVDTSENMSDPADTAMDTIFDTSVRYDDAGDAMPLMDITNVDIINDNVAMENDNVAMEDDTSEITTENATMEDAASEAITSQATDGTGTEAVADDADPVAEDGKPVEEGEANTNLKREHDDQDDDQDDAEDSTPKRTCTDEAIADAMQLGRPEIFARARMALCEAMPNFKAYKSSLYTTDCTARGMYMDAGARGHDVFKAQVIISSVGGGRDLDDDNKRVRVGDMSDNSIPLRSIKRAMDEQILIPVIVGRNHPLWTVKVEHNFNVLDWFLITDVWAELNIVDGADAPSAGNEAKTIRVFCYRLEKANLRKASWWDVNPASYVRGLGALKQTCSSCGTESKQIIDAGWTCLNHTCALFFKDSTGVKITDVHYCDSFLEERQNYKGLVPSLRPEATVEEVNGIVAYGSEAAYRAGIICDCGACVSRVFWNRWVCEHCGKVVQTKMVAYPKKLVKAEEDEFNKSVARLQKVGHIPAGITATKLDATAVRYREIDIGLYKASQFLLPDANGIIIGSVTVLHANDTICARGPDIMFDTLSVSDIGLRRNPVSGGSGANEGLSRHFGINWGAPYKFGVTVNSKGFSEAPETILQAVQQMRWAGATAVPIAAEFMDEQVGPDGSNVEDANVDFNECLSLGYMENDMIRYHDDGEKECGPTVATISLGAPAMMSFRPKKKSGMELMVSNPPKTKGTHFSAVLSFPLYHGDIAIMHGSRIHGLYEHQVEPAGGRRFALTCRYMDLEKMKTDEQRLQATIGGKMPAHAARYTYSGDGFLTTEARGTGGYVTPEATPPRNNSTQDTAVDAAPAVENTTSGTSGDTTVDTAIGNTAETANIVGNTSNTTTTNQTAGHRYGLRQRSNIVYTA